MENWKDINDFVGLYQVSNCGRIKSLGRFRNDRFYPEKIMKPQIQKGYCHINLWNNGKLFRKQIHRLVAQHFINNPLGLPEVNHCDGIKSNNNDWNLEWCTSGDNQRHAYKTGLKSQNGEKHPRHILTETQVKEILNLKGLLSEYKIAIQYGVSRGCINGILSKKKWKHISVS